MKDFKTEAHKIIKDLVENGQFSIEYYIDQLLQLHIQGVREIIGQDEDVTLKDLDPKEFNMELNQVHRQGRNELRREQRQKLEGLQPKE